MLYLIFAIVVIFIIWLIYQFFTHIYLLMYVRQLLLVLVVLMYANYFAQKKGYDFLRLFGTSIHELRVFQLRSTWHYRLDPGLKNNDDFAVKVVRPLKGEAVYVQLLCDDPDSEDEICQAFVERFY